MKKYQGVLEFNIIEGKFLYTKKDGNELEL